MNSDQNCADSMEEDEDVLDMFEDTPPSLRADVNEANATLIPEDSAERYWNAYKRFCKFKEQHNTTSSSENILLAYFNKLSATQKPTTLWSTYSMLKATLKNKEDVKIETYFKLTGFLKRKMKGYIPTKAKVLTEEDLSSFLSNADGAAWLDVRTVAVFGFAGGMRSGEIHNLTVDCVVLKHDSYIVHVKDTKTKKLRRFTIEGPFKEIVQKYIALRPKNCRTQYFFLNYRDGKCTVQNIGINKLRKMPSRIAQFLQLPNPDRYTGHSWRRSSATSLANLLPADTDGRVIQRHLGHRHMRVTEEYIDESIGCKKKTGRLIMGAINIEPTVSSGPSNSENEENQSFIRLSSTTTSSARRYCASKSSSSALPMPSSPRANCSSASTSSPSTASSSAPLMSFSVRANHSSPLTSFSTSPLPSSPATMSSAAVACPPLPAFITEEYVEEVTLSQAMMESSSKVKVVESPNKKRQINLHNCHNFVINFQ